MASYLLDTNVCVAMLRGQYGIREKTLQVGLDACFVSEISIAELFYGAYKSGADRHIKEVFDLMRIIQTVPIYDSLERYGEVKSELERAGMRIDDFDLLIGTTALHHGMTLVTHNVRHFLRIPDIILEDWETETRK